MPNNIDKRNDANYFYNNDKETVTINAGFLNYLLDHTFLYFCEHYYNTGNSNNCCVDCPISNYFPDRNCTELTYTELTQFFKDDIR